MVVIAKFAKVFTHTTCVCICQRCTVFWWLAFSSFLAHPSRVQLFKDAMQYITDKTMVNGKTCVQFKPRSSQTAYIRFVEGTGYKSCSFFFLKCVLYKRVHCLNVSNHGQHTTRFYSRVQRVSTYQKIKRCKWNNHYVY